MTPQRRVVPEWLNFDVNPLIIYNICVFCNYNMLFEQDPIFSDPENLKTLHCYSDGKIFLTELTLNHYLNNMDLLTNIKTEFHSYFDDDDSENDYRNDDEESMYYNRDWDNMSSRPSSFKGRIRENNDKYKRQPKVWEGLDKELKNVLTVKPQYKYSSAETLVLMSILKRICPFEIHVNNIYGYKGSMRRYHWEIFIYCHRRICTKIKISRISYWKVDLKRNWSKWDNLVDTTITQYEEWSSISEEDLSCKFYPNSVKIRNLLKILRKNDYFEIDDISKEDIDHLDDDEIENCLTDFTVSYETDNVVTKEVSSFEIKNIPLEQRSQFQKDEALIIRLENSIRIKSTELSKKAGFLKKTR